MSDYPVFSVGQTLTAEDLDALQRYLDRRRRKHVTITATTMAILMTMWCRLVRAN